MSYKFCVNHDYQPQSAWGCPWCRAEVAEARCEALDQALADLNIENLVRVAKEAEERGEQRIPCFLQVEWVARAAKARGFDMETKGEPS